jgi:hypothetical protein
LQSIHRIAIPENKGLEQLFLLGAVTLTAIMATKAPAAWPSTAAVET